MQPTCNGHCLEMFRISNDACYLKLCQEGKENSKLRECFDSLNSQGRGLLEQLDLRGADLRGIEIRFQILKDCDLTGANLEQAYLHKVKFEDSRLDGVNLEDALLELVDLRRVKSMAGARLFYSIFVNVLLPDPDRLGYPCLYESRSERAWHKAEYVYRHFKELYKLQGEHDHSGLFFEREMEMRRKRSRGYERWTLTGLWLTCGYGERPERAVAFAISVTLLFAGAYYFLPLVGPEGPIRQNFPAALYFSVVTFATLGYGDIRPEGWARGFATVEALIGAFTVALFVFVFCRRMSR